MRARGPGGQCTLTLPGDATVSALVAALCSALGIDSGRLEVRAGFPPTLLDLSVAPTTHVTALGLRSGDVLQAGEASSGAAGVAPTTHVAALGLRSGDALQAGEASNGAAVTQQAAVGATPAASAGASAGRAPDSVTLADGSGCVLQRRVIEADNSCLFNAVGYVLQSRHNALQLRRVVADAVAADPDTFNDAFLGRPNAEYRDWVLERDSWGGAIELSILSRHFEKEIDACDIQTGRVDRYGQGSYKERVLLLYDGIHYDALALTAFVGAPEELDVTLHPVDAPNAAALDDAVAQLLAAAKAAKAFTDTAGFTLRCIVCREGMRGQAAAAAHAKLTGHTSFGEYSA